MLFKKYHKLNHSQLAEALEYLSKEMKFEKDKLEFIEEKIKIDENITIVIDSYEWMIGYAGLLGGYNYYKFVTSMYVDGILVNEYEFKFDKFDCLKWELVYKKIHHKLSNDIIDFINDWSFKVLVPKKAKEKVEIEKQRKIREIEQEEKQKREDQTEEKLKSIYKQYRKRGRKLCQ